MSQEPPYLGQNCITPDPRSEVLMRWLWAFVQATVFRWSPRPLHGFRTRLLRLFGANIPVPSEVVVFPTVRITYPWRLTLEPRSMVGRHVTIYNLGHVTRSRNGGGVRTIARRETLLRREIPRDRRIDLRLTA